VRRFSFRLDRLLEYKRRQRKALELRVHEAAADFARARQEVDATRSLLDRYESQSAVVPARDPTSRIDALTALSLLRARWLAALDRWRVASERLAEASKALQAISREVEAYETLRRRRWEEFKRAELQKQHRWLDEIALKQWYDVS